MIAVTTRDVAYGLFGAWRLAHFDPNGMSYADRTLDGYWKSFFAAALVLPAHIAILMMTAAQAGDAAAGSQASFFRVVSVEGIAYVIDWVAFPLVMVTFAEILARQQQYVGFIVMSNWATVIQVGVILPTSALVMLSDGAALAVLLNVFAWSAVIVYAWFIARVALDVPGLTAASVIVLDLLISLVLKGFKDLILGP